MIHSVIDGLLQAKVDEEMDLQLRKKRQEWASERNALQQQNAELKVCASLSCRSILVGKHYKKLYVCTYIYTGLGVDVYSYVRICYV